jgi:hypothetical protein
VLSLHLAYNPDGIHFSKYRIAVYAPLGLLRILDSRPPSLHTLSEFLEDRHRSLPRDASCRSISDLAMKTDRALTIRYALAVGQS